MNNEPTLECVECIEPESIVSRIIRGVKYQLTEVELDFTRGTRIENNRL